MKFRTAALSAALAATALVPSAARAASSPAPASDNSIEAGTGGVRRLDDLEKKVGILTEEINRLKLGSAVDPELSSYQGLAPAASKVYAGPERKVSIGGYGELVYQNFRGRKQDGTTAGKTDTLDLQRVITYFGYKYNDWITFNSEIEFEHATDSKRGEVSVEMAQIDFKPWDPLGFRAGLLLVPVGLTNEVHEPTTFHGVNRPSTEKNIYPTTWRDNGAGVFGSYGRFTYRSYLLAGLQAVKDGAAGKVGGFSASSGLRGGRSNGSKSFAESWAVASRLDAEPVDGTTVGFSLYTGRADHHRTSRVGLTFWDLHGRTQWRGLEADGMYVQGTISNVGDLNAAQAANGVATAGNKSIGQNLFGGYFTVAYDVLNLCANNKGHYLAPFFRYERYDTQQKVPSGFLKNPANSRVEYTLGLTYKPIPQVAVKFDHQIMRNQASTGVGQTNLGVGWIF